MVLTLHLPEHIRHYIRQQVESGAFASEEAVITDAVEQAMEPSGYRWEEDEDLLEVIAAVDRGEVIEVPDIGEFMARVSREARENSAKGVKVSDEVKY